jgi:hypothetical protein
MTTTPTDIKSQRTIYYKPQTMTFRESDKKMLDFRPQSKWWKLVIKQEKLWDQQVGTGAAAVDKYLADKQEEQKNTDCIA